MLVTNGLIFDDLGWRQGKDDEGGKRDVSKRTTPLIF